MFEHHISLLEALTNLGYKGYSNGCCFGVTLKWLEAGFLDEQAAMKRRVEYIHANKNDLIIELAFVQEKIKKNQPLTRKEKKLSEVLPFLDGIHLYQKVNQQNKIYGQTLYQGDFEKASKFASCQKIEKMGGVAQIYSMPSVHTLAEMHQYFLELKEILDNVTSPHRIGFLFTNDFHAIGGLYLTKDHWDFFDINHWPPSRFKDKNISGLSQEIMKSLKADEPYLSYHTSLIVPKNLASSLESKLKEFENKTISELTLNDGKKNEHKTSDLFLMAAMWGNRKIFQHFQKLEADIRPNMLRTSQVTLLRILASNNHADCIRTIVEQNALIDFIMPDGDTALWTACKLGHYESVRALLAVHANPNIAHAKLGVTPLETAAFKGFINIAELLISWGAELDEVGSSGYAPIHSAVIGENLEMIAYLLQKGADINRLSRDGAPLHLAIQTKNENLVKCLLESGACPNIKNNFLLPPLFLAAKLGLKEIYDLLKLHHADSEYKVCFTESTLIQFLEVDAFTAEKISARFNNTEFLWLKARDIAGILGHMSISGIPNKTYGFFKYQGSAKDLNRGEVSYDYKL